MTGDLGIAPEGERSPSPPPVYDRHGVRTNTRDVRARDKLTAERQEVMEALVAADPAFKPPPGFKLAKKTMKIYIPQREYPSFNFIGMVIGPRGEVYASMDEEIEGYALATIDLDQVRKVREELQLFQCRVPSAYRSVVRKY